MRSIAAEANMTTGAIYYYYKNKQDLFDEIVTDSIHFAHRIFHENENEKITIDSLFSNVEKKLGFVSNAFRKKNYTYFYYQMQ